MNEQFPLLYLTGAPASGKSSVCREIERRLPHALVFSYSKELRRFAGKRLGMELSEDDIRRLSGQAITPEDVVGLDREMMELAMEHRRTGPFVIDSHAVTKEHYGFRVTAFSKDQLLELAPDCIVCLYNSPAETCRRIQADQMGRPIVSEFEAGMHTQLQCSVAAEYGVLLGKPVYYIDSSVDLGLVADIVIAKAKLST